MSLRAASPLLCKASATLGILVLSYLVRAAYLSRLPSAPDPSTGSGQAALGTNGGLVSAKMSAARQRAFLKALGETGNVTVSAERAKVSRSWVLKQRRADAGFEAECTAALAGARERLGAARARRPEKGWGFLDGEELVVKGSVTGPPGRRVQIARARILQITPRVEERSRGPATSRPRRGGRGSATERFTATASAGRTSSGDGSTR